MMVKESSCRKTALSGPKRAAALALFGCLPLVLFLATGDRRAQAAKPEPGPVDTGRISLFRVDTSSGACEMVLLDLDPRQEVLTIPACATQSESALPPAAWSHAGSVRWLVFRRRTAGALDGFWAMLEDGTGTHQVVPQASSDFNDPFHPSLSRDDQWLAFTAKAAGSTTHDVFIQGFDPLTATVTGPPVNLTQGSVAARDVAVFGPSLPSNGQSSLAFTATGPGGLRDVYRIDLSFGVGGPVVTGGPTNLTNTSGIDEGPAYGLDWSAATVAWPAGRLAFTRGPSEFPDEIVHMAPVPGAAAARVTRGSVRGKVSWSPLADRIVHGASLGGGGASQSDVLVVSPDGRGKVNITGTNWPVFEWYPTWRP